MIANYTSTVPATKSVNEITGMLVKAGATAIATEYEGGRIIALSFAIRFRQDVFHYTLPVRIGTMQDVLKAQKADRRFLTLEHAERVAWRILRDWVRAQMAIIETEMVSLQQVMLPYMRTATGDTVFEAWETYNTLPAGSTS